jgi:glycine dehydrogenase subunit 2
VTLVKEAKKENITALEVAKCLLDFDFYAPTIYFPLLIKEAMLIEPTETESKQTLDAMIAAMQKIKDLMQSSPKTIREAPSRLPCKRLDEVKAARDEFLVWQKHKD